MLIASFAPVAYWCGIVLLIIVCAIWGLLLIGAYAAHLVTPGLLKSFALKRKLAARIMKYLVVELSGFVVAVGVLIIGFIQSSSLEQRSVSLEQRYEKSAATLLCQVRAVETRPAVVSSVEAFAELPGKFQATLIAYREFLKSTGQPNLVLLTQLVPDDPTVYDFRLLGMAYIAIAEGIRDPHQSTQERDYVDKAEQMFRSALEGAREELPGAPDSHSATHFLNALHGSLADVRLVRLRDHLVPEEERTALFDEVTTTYKRMIRESGGIPATHLNLIAVHSIMEKYEEALKLLEALPSERRLSEFDLQVILEHCLDIKERMPELEGLAKFVEETKQIEWKEFLQVTLGAN